MQLPTFGSRTQDIAKPVYENYADYVPVGSNIWLKRWVMTSQAISSPRGLETLIGLYLLLGLAGGFIMGLSTFIIGFCCTEVRNILVPLLQA